METANEIMKQVVPILMVPINRHLRYLILCTMYMREMHIKMRELNDAKVDVEEKRRQNISNNLEVPPQVEGWLEAVGNISAKVENVSRDIGSCFNLKTRHRAGRDASEINEDIDSVMKRCKEINWADHPIPPGRVDSMTASTSTPSIKHNDFQSREATFTEALKALAPNQTPHMIALCGMGGVGKTTLMQRLRKVVQEKRMFNFVMVAVIGEKTDPIAIQDAIADYIGVQLHEITKQARADKLRQEFKAKSDGGKNTFFVILDDVWQPVDLEDIGLNPLPNQGINFKVLLTSRDRHVCTLMGVEANSILNVGLLKKSEAQSLFWQFVETPDPELHKIGEDIVRKCCGLPIAIKTMALTLKNKNKDAWKDALSRLENHDINDIASKVFETSYNNLQDEETKSTFLLCGLYPEDFNIPTEELVRYGWGLKLFKKVFTIREARTRLNTCIERLIHTNLLMEGDDDGCIKMHDLVRAFVLDLFSKTEHASVVNHGSMSGWPENDINSSSCKRISLTCKNMSEFPGDLKFRNLLILKLMHGDKSLKFRQDFYREMETLQVVSYSKMKYPLIPSSPQCSTSLRVLHLHECKLMKFDYSSIGNLSNMEVLSFANSDIIRLPSTIGNLKKLRLLDLTDCYHLHIDNGILRNLVRLEELYMGVSDQCHEAISLTDENCNEMAERSKNLTALEFQLVRNNAPPKNMSFEKLQRFKISIGCYISEGFRKSRYSFQNTLQLVTNKDEVLKSRIKGLFEKTEVLHLSVGDMSDLEDVEVKSSHPPQSSSFYNLRVLKVHECAELRYLFTLGVAKALSNLERLTVHECNNMEQLIHTGTNGEETITFPRLKFLSLDGLPKLSGLCHDVNVIELPQLVELELKVIPGFTSIYPGNKLETCSVLTEQIVIPNLETLYIDQMDDLKEIWPCELSTTQAFKLREIKVKNCGNLVNLFPCNLMSLLDHLQELEVRNQWTVFEFPNLTRLLIYRCHRLEHVFTSSMVGSLLQLQELGIEECYGMKEVIAKDADVEELEEESDVKIKEMMLPRLKFLQLDDLVFFKGFCLEKVDFSFPLLDTLRISGCPFITTFTKGNISTPELRKIGTAYHSLYVAGEDINSIINIKQEAFKEDKLTGWLSSKFSW